MQSLPWQQVQAIEQLLTVDTLQDLVAVFSQTVGAEYLFVYNALELPAPMPPNIHPRRLLDVMQSHEYLKFAGVVVGFPAIDAALPDVSTLGVNFYSIEHLRQAGQFSQVMRQTAYRLALTLLDHLDGLAAEASSESQSDYIPLRVIQLATPTLLSNRPLDHLLAILPKTSLREYVDRRCEGYQRITVDGFGPDYSDLLRHLDRDPDGNWIVTLEEVLLFHPEWADTTDWPTRFVDLRPVLRCLGRPHALQQICRALARRCWRSWLTTRKDRFYGAAYSLAAEAALYDEDVEDLVALLPPAEFERFVETGEAVRIYREPLLTPANSSAASKPKRSLADLLRGTPIDTANAGCLIALPSVPVLLKPSVSLRPIDLAPILWKAGKDTQLARTLWLLSRDLLKGSVSEYARANVAPAAITDLATRAALICGLSDPWSWRQGRYEHFLQQVYRHLMDCLTFEQQLAQKDPSTKCFEGLRLWYGSLTTDDQSRDLGLMRFACQQYVDSTPQTGRLDDHRTTARRLIHIAGMLGEQQAQHHTHRETNEEPARRFEVARYLRQVADSAVPVRTPTQAFEHQLSLYSALHHRWLQLQESAGASRPSDIALKQLLSKYQALERTTYLPAHELVILRQACSEDIKRIRGFRQAFESGPLITVHLKNPWIILNKDQRLTFEIENIGESVASLFKIDLATTRGVDLIAPFDSSVPGELAPNRPHQAMCTVRAKEPAVKLILLYTFRDAQHQSYSHQEELSLEVRRPTSANIKPYNPYEVGRPVSGEEFFGRLNELEKILAQLARGSMHPTLLHGPRRQGKTSLMREIELILKDPRELRRLGLAAGRETQLERIHPMFVSLQAMTQGSDRLDFARPDFVSMFLQNIAKRIWEHFELPVDEPRMTAEFNRYPADAFIRYARRVFEQRPDARILMLIDEWDEIYQRGVTELSRNLRYLLQEEQRISWIFSSTMILAKEGGQFSSPFFSQLYTFPISELAWGAAIDLVETLSNRAGVEWYGDAIVTAVEQTGQRPFLLQLLSSHITGRLIDKSQNIVDNEVVLTTIGQIVKGAQNVAQYFGSLWNTQDVEPAAGDVCVRWMGRLILWVLTRSYSAHLTHLEIAEAIKTEFRDSQLAQPYSNDAFNREFNDQIDKLHSVFDAITLDENNRYHIEIPLTRRWLQQVIGKENEVDLIRRAHAGLLQDLQGG
jgi:hypothetical protein